MAEKPKQDKPAQGSLVAEALAAIEGLAAGGTMKKKLTLGPSREAITEAMAPEIGGLPPGFEPWEEGDEWVYGLDPTAKARLKAYMSSSGLYGKGVSRSGGAWTRDDAAAFAEVLAFANANGITDEITAARQFAEMAQTEGGLAKAPREPLVTRMANPEAVRQVVRRTSLQLTGRRLSDEEEARLVSGFSAQYTGAQQAQYGASGAEAGGSYMEPLSAEEYATSQLEGTAEAGDRRYLDAFDRILKSATSTMVSGPTLTGTGGIEQ